MMAAATSALIRVLPSTLRNWSLEATPRQPLEYDPNDERTSFFISKDPVKGTKLLEISKGDFEKQDYKNLDLLLALHIQASSHVFLESLHPTQNIYFTRELVGSRPPKWLLPRSKAPQERILVLLDCDSNIFIDDEIIEFKIGSSNSVPSPGNSTGALETGGDIPMGHDEEEDPHILVQQSHPQELLRRGSTDLAYLTPAVPETIMEEPGVQETPSVKSRFMNPDSATVTLPRALPREDTFEFDELTPGGNKSTAKTLFPSNSLEFGGHNDNRLGEMGFLTMDDANLSTSDEEDEIIVQNSRFFKSVPEPDSVESTADEEAPEAPTRGVADIMNSTTSTIILPQTPASGKENLGSRAEDMRRQFSEAPMIRSFNAGPAGASKEASPAAGEEDDRRRRGSKSSDMSTKPMKQGIPEGFLYEEHKKDVTPKQTYGKNKRTPRTKPRGKNPDMDKRIERAISEDGLKLRGRDKPKDKNRKIKGTQEDDESDEKEQEIPSRRRRRNTRANEAEDAIMETSDDMEEEITLSSKIQESRGKMTVQSQPDSTAETVTAVGPELKSGRPSRRKAPTPEQKEQGNEEPDVEEKGAEPASTTKSTRPRRGTRKQSDTSAILPSSAQTTTTPTRSTRKRRRTPDDGQESRVGEDDPRPPSAGEEGSVIRVAEPQAKRAKATPPKKPATKTPVSKRGRRKGPTPTPPVDDSEQFLGDTQYTFPDATQTQAMDRVEVKTSVKTPKTTKKKATPKTSTTPSSRNKKEAAEEEKGPEAEEAKGVDEQKTRTSDRYDGDSPKIVFSNSGLGERKDIEKFLRANGGKKMQNVSAPGVNFLVVGPGELKRTPKLTVGVTLGRWVVEDQWLIDSKEIGYFLDPSPYIPHDPMHEKAWSFSLRTAITRGRNGENNILKDHIVYITPALLAQLKASKQEESLIEMLKTTGAGSIIKKTPKCRKEDDESGDKSLVLGTEKGDSDVAGLEKLGWNVYGTGIIAVSVLRGQLGLGEEFKIVAEKEESHAVGRGRKGK